MTARRYLRRPAELAARAADALTPPRAEPRSRRRAGRGADPPTPAARPTATGVLRALSAADPPVDALRAAASALALTEPARARSLVQRARIAGWLPELRARRRSPFRAGRVCRPGPLAGDPAGAGRN